MYPQRPHRMQGEASITAARGFQRRFVRMKKLAGKILLVLSICLCLGTSVFAVEANAAKTVKNATVKKSGKYYIGYKKSGKKIRNKWGIVKSGSKSYTYYFDGKGRAYTGVRAIGEIPADTKLYFFSSKGRLNSSKTSKLQKLSAQGKKYKTLKSYIARIDKKAICKAENACGMEMCTYNNGFTIYMDTVNSKLISYILVNQ